MVKEKVTRAVLALKTTKLFLRNSSSRLFACRLRLSFLSSKPPFSASIIPIRESLRAGRLAESATQIKTKAAVIRFTTMLNR